MRFTHNGHHHCKKASPPAIKKLTSCRPANISPALFLTVVQLFDNWRVGMVVTDGLASADLQPPWWRGPVGSHHYNDVIMSVIACYPTTVYSAVYSGTDERKHQSSASLAFVWGIHRWPVNSSHKAPVTRKMFPFDDVIMWWHHQMETFPRHRWSPLTKASDAELWCFLWSASE